jgi:hypothetical protein
LVPAVGDEFAEFRRAVSGDPGPLPPLDGILELDVAHELVLGERVLSRQHLYRTVSVQSIGLLADRTGLRMEQRQNLQKKKKELP